MHSKRFRRKALIHVVSPTKLLRHIIRPTAALPDSKHDGVSWQSIKTWSSDDVFLVSYPRSGNTWMRYLMTNLRFPDAEWDLNSLAFAFPEIGGPIKPSSVPRPRWIKSHLSYDPSYPRVIYLIRDVRDVAVSFYFWTGKEKEMSFKDFLINYITNDNSDIVPWVAWHSHIEGYLAKQSNLDMIIIQYENLVEDTITELERICQFVGLDRTTQDIETAIQKSTIDKQQTDFQHHEALRGKRVGVSGRPGKWKELFDEELLTELYHTAGETMEALGYKYE